MVYNYANMGSSPDARPLRLWPGVVIVVLQWLIMFVLPILAPDQGGIGIIVGILSGLVVVVWWLCFSRAPWPERLGAVALMGVAVAAITPLVHRSISGGMMGFMRFVYAAPLVSVALVTWATATRRLPTGRRRASMAALLLACVPLTLVRTNGLTGGANSDFQWRWTPTAEERLLAGAVDETPKASVEPPVENTPALPPPPEVPEVVATTPELKDSARVEWPGFRGPARDSVVRGVRIETDWAKTPPVELWRHPIGPGWSSFAVSGDRIYTQEQRGGDEVVSAYALKTGEPVWRHRDSARFWESNAGAGPRATPTLDNGRVYTLGATGILNALDARDGSVVWSRNAVSDTGKKIPDWGIAGSPLIVGDIVIVATGGWLAAYDAATGKPKWFGPKEGGGYSSPHLATLGGVPQVVLVNGPGAIAVAPADGKILWKHEWPGDSIVQPVVIGDSDLLIGSGSGLADKSGVVRLTISRDAGEAGWNVQERWMSTGLKPYFNDFVAHAGHAFGFDGSILACIDLEDGARKWKGGRYGHGQLMLLADQDLLLVLSEDGELALVAASGDQFNEIAKVPALQGKTWNHPVLIGDTLLVRNGEEMAAFRVRLVVP